MADYGVKFNNAGHVSTPQWTAAVSENFSIDIEFTTGALSSTDGVYGEAAGGTPSDYLALYADGKYVFRIGDLSTVVTPTGLIAASTRYRFTAVRTGGNSIAVTMYAADGTTVIRTDTVTSSNAHKFNQVGSVGTAPLAFDGTVWKMTVTGGTQARTYQSTVNTGTSWAETTSAQDGTLTSLATDGSEWVLDSTATPIAFTGTVPAFTFTNGDAVSEDLTTYFSGTQTPFTYTNTGTSLAGSGLTLSSAGLLSGTATTSTITGVIITGTDTDTATAASNAFDITTQAVSDGVITTTVYNNAGTLQVNQTGITADLYDLSTGALVLRTSSLTTDASGVLTFSDAAITTATEYRLVISQGAADGVERSTAA